MKISDRWSDLVADVNTLQQICIGWGGEETPCDGTFISVFGPFLFPQLLNLVADFGSESRQRNFCIRNPSTGRGGLNAIYVDQFQEVIARQPVK